MVLEWNYSGVMDDVIRFSLRLPSELHARLASQARHDRRSLNSELVYLLEVALDVVGVDANPPNGESA